MRYEIFSLSAHGLHSKQYNISYLKQQSQLAFQHKNYLQASIYLKKLLKIMPEDSDTLLNFAYAELKQQHNKVAYKFYQLALKYHPRHFAEIYDGLAEVCYYLKKKEEQIHYARCALETKKQQVAQEFSYPIPTQNAPQFNAANRLENIISYSLFGGEARYCENAIHNVKRAKVIFPEWTCRFYVDNTVPDAIIVKLQVLGAQVIFVTEQQGQISGLFWRFFVLEDAHVKRFLIRDADSILSYREQATVIAWIKAKTWFHTLCDAYSHTELILAGLWGGCNGIFKNVQQNIEQYIATNATKQCRTLDQHYLRQRIYPTLQHNVLIHDSQFYHSVAHNFPPTQKQFPEENTADFHVGKNDATYFIHMQLPLEPIKSITWFIVNEDAHEVCRYTHCVKQGQQHLSFAIPSAYAFALDQKKWHLFHEIKKA